MAASACTDALAGTLLTGRDLRVPRLATADLSGAASPRAVPRGKHLLTRVEGGLTLHSHLRMDGAWQSIRAGQRWRGGPAHQIRAILATAERTAVGLPARPSSNCSARDDEDRAVGHLGPDLLGPDWDADEALRRLLADPPRPLGEALLDQRNLAGIGNVYKSELCFLPGSRPGCRSAKCPTRPLVALAGGCWRRTRPAGRRHRDPPRPGLWVYGRPAGLPALRDAGPRPPSRAARAGSGHVLVPELPAGADPRTMITPVRCGRTVGP